jgi:hypothetical protein
LKLTSAASGAQGGDGIMGPVPASTSSVNMGSTPPLPQPPPPTGRIPHPTQVNYVLPHQRAPIIDTVHVEADKSEGRRSWMPKMDFPHIDGTDARIWLDKCLAYFALYQIPSAFRVSAVSIHMSGQATHWFQTFKLNHWFQQWDQFASVVISEFETNTHRAKIMELLKLKQTRGVREYRRDFEHYVYHIKLYDNIMGTSMLTAQFLLGLKEELRSVVEL